MKRHHLRAIALMATTTLLMWLPAEAQSPTKEAPRRLSPTTSSAAAKAAFSAALEEVENIGGGGRYDAKLKAVVDADPDFALGRAYYGAWTSSMSSADRLRELNQAIKDAATASTTELLLVTALRESRAGRNQQARAITDLVIDLVPDDPHVRWLRLVIAANDEDAIKVGRAATTKFPDYAPAWNILAYQLDNIGTSDEAIAAVKKYVALAPNHPNPYDSYGEILARHGKLDESDAQYQKVLDLDPGFEVAHEGMAENDARRGDYAAARAHLQKSLASAATPQRRINVMREIAATYVFESRMKDAVRQMEASIQAGQAAELPAFVQADHRALGLLAAAQGKSGDALKHFNAGAAGNTGPFAPLAEAVLHGALGNAAEVAKANSAIQKNAAAALDNQALQQAAHATQVINAVMNKDLASARQHYTALETPSYKAMSGAFLYKPLARSADKAAAQAVMQDVADFNDLSLNSAIAHTIAHRK